MKKPLITCSLLCLLAALASFAAPLSESNEDIKQTESTATATSAPVIAETPSDDESKNSPTQIKFFGNPIGIYHFNWRFDIERIQNDLMSSSDADYIADSVNDPSMMLNLKLPVGDESSSLLLNVGFDVHRLGNSTSFVPVTEALTTEATTTTQTPTTAAPTTQTPTTQTPTTQVPVTEAPATQAPVTTAKPISGANPQIVPAMSYTDEDLLWLARIIYAEAGGESIECQIAVGTTVLNRVASSSFPNTIYGVIFEPNQFTPARSGSIYNTPSAASYEAARRCLGGERSDTRILYFQTAAVASGSWMHNARKFIFTLDGVNFYA